MPLTFNVKAEIIKRFQFNINIELELNIYMKKWFYKSDMGKAVKRANLVREHFSEKFGHFL